jgi:hypothetical protein
MKQVKVVIDGGREAMVNHFVDEYQSLLAHLKALHIDPSPDGVFKYLFGEGSRLAEVMTRTLNITHKEYCVFLATFFLAAEFKRVPKVLQEHERIDYDGFMDYNQYNALWRAIGDVGKGGFGDKLWEEIQDALNKTCKSLLLSEEHRAAILESYWTMTRFITTFQQPCYEETATFS